MRWSYTVDGAGPVLGPFPLASGLQALGATAGHTFSITYTGFDGPLRIELARAAPQLSAIEVGGMSACDANEALFSGGLRTAAPLAAGLAALQPVAPTEPVGALTDASLSQCRFLNYTLTMPLPYTAVQLRPVSGAWNTFGFSGFAAPQMQCDASGSLQPLSSGAWSTASAGTLPISPAPPRMLQLQHTNDGNYVIAVRRAAPLLSVGATWVRHVTPHAEHGDE